MYQNLPQVKTNDPFRPRISLGMIEASSLRWRQTEDNMKRFALVVAALYLLTLVVLTAPVIKLAFGVPLAEAAKSYLQWHFWLWGLAMVVGQLALLSVPVRVANRRPVARRSLLPPILTTGLLAGGLVMGAFFSIHEFIFRGAGTESWVGWATLTLVCLGYALLLRSRRVLSLSRTLEALASGIRLNLRNSLTKIQNPKSYEDTQPRQPGQCRRSLDRLHPLGQPFLH
jgi:hypothetical protein